jgi:hypothetical protein
MICLFCDVGYSWEPLTTCMARAFQNTCICQVGTVNTKIRETRTLFSFLPSEGAYPILSMTAVFICTVCVTKTYVLFYSVCFNSVL